MSSLYRVTGIVLNRRNVGSADRFVKIFAPSGKHEFRARGTQKLESKLAGSLEPLSLVELTIARGRTMDQITGSSLRHSFRNVHENLPRVAGASLIVSAVDVLVHGRLDDSLAFKHVLEALVLVGKSSTNRQIFLAVAYGLWNLVSCLGFSPTLAMLGVKPAVSRLIVALLRGTPTVPRRIRCTVGTARSSVEAAVAFAQGVSERSIPAAAFFWRALPVVS